MPAFVSEAHRPRRVMVALAVGAVAVVSALGLGLGYRGGTASRPGTATTLSVPSPTAPAAAGGPATVNIGALSWTSFHGVWLPVSAHDGPRTRHNDLASGFTQTPTGALLAAFNIVLRADAQWGPPVFAPTIRNQVVGADAAVLLTALRDYYASARQVAGVPDGQPLGPAYVTEAGFRWQSYTPTAATVDLLSAGPGQGGSGTVQVATRVQLLWQAGDWRVVAPPGGSWANSASQVTSTAGFALFPGQR